MMDRPTEGKNGGTSKVALAHDFLVSYGGAERVLQELIRMYPGAPVYTLLTDPEVVAQYFPDVEIRTSFLQRWPRFLRRRYPLLLPLYPVAVETLDLRDFSLVISSTGAWMKGLVTRLDTKHVAYIHSPLRYVWDTHAEYVRECGFWGGRLALRFVTTYLRLWDRAAATRPDLIIANSIFTARRIEKYYRRECQHVYPPADFLAKKYPGAARSEGARQGFLVVSRLTRAKGLHAVIEAFHKLHFSLTLVGSGRERKRLEQLARGRVVFAGALSDEALASAYRTAEAVIVPSEEDFGLVAAEALSFGTPLIALNQGGINEILTAPEYGEFFAAATPEVLAAAVNRFRSRRAKGAFIPERMAARAAQFSTEAFQNGIQAAVRRVTAL